VGNQIGVGERGQLDEPHAMVKIPDEALRDLQRHPRLARAARASECDQPLGGDERLHVRDLPLPSDEPGELRRQVVRDGRRRRCNRRVRLHRFERGMHFRSVLVAVVRILAETSSNDRLQSERHPDRRRRRRLVQDRRAQVE
jgi:hypothetical protein